jgi:hypothetical protein
MHRRPLGRGRVLAVLAAIVLLVGCLVPWYGVGGGGELPSLDLRAFDGSGILTFLAALATLALVTLPYAAGDRPVTADRGLFYLLILVVAILGVALWPLRLSGEFGGLVPTRAPGFWTAIVGIIVLGRATYDIFREPAYR